MGKKKDSVVETPNIIKLIAAMVFTIALGCLIPMSIAFGMKQNLKNYEDDNEPKARTSKVVKENNAFFDGISHGFNAVGKSIKSGIDFILPDDNQASQAVSVVKESGSLKYNAKTNSDIMIVNRTYSNGQVEEYGYDIPLDKQVKLEDKRDSKLYEQFKKSDEYKESVRKQFNTAGSEAKSPAASAVETSESEFTSAAAFAEYSAKQVLNSLK